MSCTDSTCNQQNKQQILTFLVYAVLAWFVLCTLYVFPVFLWPVAMVVVQAGWLHQAGNLTALRAAPALQGQDIETLLYVQQPQQHDGIDVARRLWVGSHPRHVDVLAVVSITRSCRPALLNN
jgi:hypothetical protein